MDPYFLELFEPEIDWDGIEGARGEVRPGDLPSLVAFYQSLDDWPRKVALEQLVQDHRAAELEPVMLDVLRAPMTRTWLDDTIELTKAIALGQLSEQHDRFMHYYNDRAALKADVEAFLAARGLSVQPPVGAPRPPRQPLDSSAPAEARLLDAIERDDLAGVLAVLDEGLDVDGQYTHPRLGDETATPLIYALMVDKPAIAEALLDRGALAAPTRPGGQSALWWSAGNGSTHLVQRLLAAGADVDGADRYGGTPLQQAVRGNVETVRALLDAGARIDPTYQDGRTPIWFAAYEGRTDVVEALLDHGVPIDAPQAGKTVLHLAAGENHLELVDRLLARGADPNVRSATGLTPLMVAARRGFPRIVERLVAGSADPTLTAGPGEHQGKTASSFAVGARAEAIRAALSPPSAGARSTTAGGKRVGAYLAVGFVLLALVGLCVLVAGYTALQAM